MAYSRSLVLTVVAASLVLSRMTCPVLAAKPTVSKEKVELFAAMKSEQVEVKLIPQDAKQATVIIRNKTNRPLSIQLPDAFVGMPVLAQDAGGRQRGNRNGGGGGGGGNNSNSANQSMGGGMMGGMGGMGGMGMGGGFFDVGPDRIGKLKVATVCLEHGKEDPNPRVAYELRPIQDFTQDPALIEVCRMLGRGELEQNTAQAAAWSLSDQMTWQELAQKIRIKHLNGSVEHFFSAGELQVAQQAVQVAHHRAAEERSNDADSETRSPGEIADELAADQVNEPSPVE